MKKKNSKKRKWWNKNWAKSGERVWCTWSVPRGAVSSAMFSYMTRNSMTCLFHSFHPYWVLVTWSSDVVLKPKQHCRSRIICLWNNWRFGELNQFADIPTDTQTDTIISLTFGVSRMNEKTARKRRINKNYQESEKTWFYLQQQKLFWGKQENHYSSNFDEVKYMC